MSTRTLTSTPGLAGSYLRAGLGALPLPGSRPTTLRDDVLHLPGVHVDRGHLADYAQVCGFGNGDTLPGTYPHLLGFPLQMQLMSAREFPFPLLGLVHVGNRIRVHRAIDAGETLDVTVRAADLRAHDRGRQVDLVTEVDTDGERVWESTSTYLHTEGRGSGGGARTEPEPPSGGVRWRLPGDLGRRYAAVSGDRNPIHLHPLSAKAFGFPRAIAHGMWTAARVLAALQGRLPDAASAQGHGAQGHGAQAYVQEVAFRRPVLLPSTVAFTADADGPGWRVSVLDARRGTPHLTGSVTPG